MNRRIQPHVPLAAIRRRLGYTQSELAPLVGITQAQLARIEAGASGASLETLRALEKSLALKEGELTTAYRPRVKPKRYGAAPTNAAPTKTPTTKGI